jgi:UDP-glucose 4-epimerase
MGNEGRRRILITGVSRFLGLRIAKRFEDDPDVDLLVGVDIEPPPVPIKGLEFVRADIRNPLIAKVLETTEVDTLVHTNISSTPASLGGRSQMKENNVIGTMQLLAAAQHASRLKKVVVKSSSAVYGSSPSEPSIISEEYASRTVDLRGYGKDCSEAETYARDFGRRRPDVDLVILRTQNVVGPTVKTSMSDYLSLPLVPTALGFDPRLQLLHETDAVEGFYKATTAECKGIFNLGADGVVYLSQAIRMLGRIQVPILLPLATTTATVLRRFGLIDFPADQIRLILYGRVLDTQRAKEAFGFKPTYSTEDAVMELRDRAQTQDPKTAHRPIWEQELIDYLRRRNASDREMV